MLSRGLAIVCAGVVACGAPLASARMLVSGDITTEATSPSGAVVPFPTDAGVTCLPTSGSQFPIGTTTVNCTLDADGSPAGSFNVTVQDTTAPTLTVPGDQTVAATGTTTPFGYSGLVTASDIADPSPTVVCTPASPGPFPLGETTVSCTATDNASPSNSTTKTFKVTASDTTAPELTVPGDQTITATGATTVFNFSGLVSATDNIDPAPTVVCTPASPGPFPLGETTVSCAASDSSQSTTKTFKVTVNDTTAPELTVPGDQTITPTGATTVFNFSGLVSATDNVDPSPTVICTPASPGPFPLGETTVSCTAADNSGQSTTKTFKVTVSDTAAPVITVPANISAEASGPSGAAVTFSVTATDAVDPSPTISCDHASDSTFPIGATQVSCTAKDASNNTSSPAATFTVNVVDTTGPTFHDVPAATIQREANGPDGSAVTYTSPTATDKVDVDPLVITCLPASGSKFPLGTTAVKCTATDSHSNASTVSLSVKVVDTTEPVLTVPDDLLVSATTEAGIPKSNATVSAFLAGATATDIVDKTLTIGNNAPELFPVGATIVTFSTTDDSGNTAKATAALVVFPPGDTPPPPLPGGGGVKDRTPPDDVKNLAARPGSRKITLSWTKPAAADFDHVTITRTLIDGTAGTVVYTGRGTSHVDSSVQNGVEYRYTVVSFDASGNRSAGAVVAATPGQPLLLTPRDGARVKRTKTIRLSWARVKDADYYNVQLYLVTGLSARSAGPAKSQAETKVLSVWPKKTRFVLKKRWKFAGIRRQLRPGVYHWYVWPGFGNRKAVNYGPLMGSSTIVVVR